MFEADKKMLNKTNKLIQKAPLVYIYGRIIRNKKNEIDDFIFLDINKTLENNMGFEAKDIINKKASQLFPELNKLDSEWIKLFGEVAANLGEEVREMYSHTSKKWYKVNVYSPEKDHFIAYLTDISIEKLILNISKHFLEHKKTLDYQGICDDLLYFTNAKYIALNIVEDNEKDFSTVAVSGLNKHFKKGAEILGFDFLGKKWNYDPAKAKKTDKNIITRFKKISDLTGEVIPRNTIVNIEAFFKTGEIAVVKIVHNKKQLGDFIIIMKEGEKLQNDTMWKVYAQQIGVFLENYKSQQKLAGNKERLESILKVAPIGIGLLINRVFLEVNDRICEITGYKKEELIGKNARILYPDDEEFEFVGTKKYAQIKIFGTGAVETRWKKKNGEIIDVYLSSTPLNINDLSKGITFTVADITERKANEKNLIRLSTGIEQSPASILITDIEGNIEYVNNKFTEITGYSKEEVIGRNPRILKSGKQDNDFYKDLWNTILNGDEWQGEMLNKKKNGELYWELAYITPVKNEKGEIINFIAIKEDITEKRELKKLNKMLLSSLPHPAMYIRGKDRVVLAANKIALDFGVTIGGQCWREFGKSEYIKEKHKEIAKKYPGFVPPEYGVKCSFCQGDECFTNGSEQNNPEVHAFGLIWDTYWIKVSDDVYLHYTVDITESEKAEQALRESEDKHRYLIENIEHIFWKHDIVTDRWTYLSPQVERILGYKPDEFTNYEFWINNIHPDDRKWASKYCEDCVNKGLDHSFEYRFRKKDGSFVWIFDEVKVITENKKPVRAWGIMKDITLSKQMKETQKKLLQKEKLAFLGTLASSITHEVNNSLSGIINCADRISNNPDSINNKKYVDLIKYSSQNLKNYARDLLGFAKTHEEKLELLQLSEIIETPLFLAAEKTEKQNIFIDKSGFDEKIKIKGNKNQLEQVLLNIILNSIDAIIEKKKKDINIGGIINIKSYSDSLFAIIEITDNGIGIPQKDIKKVFDLFYSKKLIETATGLGMSISRNIVKKHGGDIQLQSQVNKGTKVIVKLPLIQ